MIIKIKRKNIINNKSNNKKFLNQFVCVWLFMKRLSECMCFFTNTTHTLSHSLHRHSTHHSAASSVVSVCAVYSSSCASLSPSHSATAQSLLTNRIEQSPLFSVLQWIFCSSVNTLSHSTPSLSSSFISRHSTATHFFFHPLF